MHTVEHANEDYEEITTSEVQDILNQRVVHNYEDYENLEFLKSSINKSTKVVDHLEYWKYEILKF